MATALRIAMAKAKQTKHTKNSLLTMANGNTKPRHQKLQQQKCWTKNSNLDAARITVAPPFESKKVQLIDLCSLSHQPAQLEQY